MSIFGEMTGHDCPGQRAETKRARRRARIYLMHYTRKLRNFCAAVALPLLGGCLPANSAQRAEYRGVVTSLAYATRALDVACFEFTQEHVEQLELRGTCATGYGAARASLMAAESILDTFESAKLASLACSIQSAAESILRVAAAYEKVGGEPLPAVQDAAALLMKNIPPCKAVN